MRVLSIPQVNKLGKGESGIHTCVRKHHEYGPQFGIEFVDENDSPDLVAVHAGMANLKDAGVPVVSHLHGFYWTADYSMGNWAHAANKSVTQSVLASSVVTVPSEWVAHTIRRDFRLNPFVLPHGIDTNEWKPTGDDRDYVVLYAKNRAGFDVCDPSFITEFARAMPQQRFVATFAPEDAPGNVLVTGVVPYEEMKKMVGHCSAYVTTTKETFGIGALEAVASGIPVVGFDEGGIKAFVQHGVNGYLARVGDYGDLMEGLHYCLQHRAVLGANGVEVAKLWTWEKAVEKLGDIYRYAMVSQDKGSVPMTIDSSLYLY